MSKKDQRPPNGQEKRSPLYTSKSDRSAKLAVISDSGKDADGAYRAAGRKDAGQ